MYSDGGAVDRPDIIAQFPLSSTQQRCWFLNQMTPGNPALNVAVRWSVQGRLREGDLEQAFQQVIDRHEILRTRFVEVDGTPQQQVAERVNFKLDVVDLRTLSPSDQADRLATTAQEFSGKPFDLATPGLIRAALFKLAADKGVIVFVVHQTCFDGVSIRVLAREVGEIAHAVAEGRTPDVPELDLQYGDFSLWQRDYLASGVLEEETAYWLKTLENLSYFEVAPDKPRPPLKSTDAGHVIHILPVDFGDKLEQTAQRLGVSTFTFGAGVFSAVLGRITGQRDVLFGTQIAGRLDTDLDNLIGVFINNMVLRFDTDLDRTISAHVAGAKAVVEGALAHQTMPFNVLVERLNPRRDPSRTPLISVNFVLQNIFMETATYGDFTLSSTPSEMPGAIYDLDLAVIGRKDRCELNLDYAATLFEPETAEAIIETVIAAFEFAFDNVTAQLSEIPMPALLAQRGDAERKSVRSAEEALLSHPLVREAATIRDGTGRYGFVVPGDTGTLPLESLPPRIMDHVAESGVTLTGVSLLGAFPRSVTGEVNTSLLQIPARRQAATAPVAARDDIIVALKDDWVDILGVERVRRGDHFFDLGGHSVLVLRQLNRIRDRWDITLDVTALYENPVLADLALVITECLGTPRQASPKKDWRFMTLSKDGDGQPLIAINNAATGQALSRTGTVQRPVFCARVAEGNKGLQVTDQSFEEIAEVYADVIATGQPDGPYFLYGNCVHGNIALETARVLQMRGAEIAGVVMKDVWEPGYTARIHGNRKARRAEKWFSFRSRWKSVRKGEMSFGAFIRFYGLFHRLGIVAVATKLGLMSRQHATDLSDDQQRFVSAVSGKRNAYRPAPITFPVLHIVTEITPTGKCFLPSVGWEDIVEDGKLHTVPIDRVMVLEGQRFGIERMAAEVEAFLGER